VAPRLVATRADLEALVRRSLGAGRDGSQDDHPLLRGWRREVAGDAVLAALAATTGRAPTAGA
jgi:hypothetical protein